MTINTITLCGSTRFLSHFEAANIELTKQGFSVISISMALPKDELGIEFEEELKQYLDLVHFNKILRSDGIFIVGTGYIGKSTAREILWAHMQNKTIVAESTMSRYNNKWKYAASTLRSGIQEGKIISQAKHVIGLLKDEASPRVSRSEDGYPNRDGFNRVKFDESSNANDVEHHGTVPGDDGGA
jgi:hypothetical protein